eukprot:6979057-Prymnesium_polylepis.1
MRWSSISWSCGVSCGGTSGAVAFDLNTATPVSYFSLWYDVLSSQPNLVPDENASTVKTTLRQQQIDRNAFWS